jgi:hypothetical protein
MTIPYHLVVDREGNVRQVYGDDGLAWIDHDGVVAETEKAKLYSIGNEEIWLPKSQIEDENEELVAIPKWLAEKKGLGSDW